ncbi:MAG: hypothetical protein JNM38_14465 [Acidobacteria bacterium]|jgi:predicted anti-sigma-YlaC factor YlaD|nr:hypothetical protein [Acidobacteriota bacterium]
MTGATPCAHEARVLAQRRLRAEDPFVREHLAGCASCREAVDVADFLGRMAAAPDPHRLPDASRVWFRAQLVRKWDAERRAAAPIETMQRAERGLLVVGLVVLIWMWTQAERWLGSADPASSASVVSSILPSGVLATVALVAVIALVGSVALLRSTARD